MVSLGHCQCFSISKKDAIIKFIYQDITAGMSVVEACKKCNIHQASYYQWMTLQSKSSNTIKKRFTTKMFRERMTSPVLGPITNDLLHFVLEYHEVLLEISQEIIMKRLSQLVIAFVKRT